MFQQQAQQQSFQQTQQSSTIQRGNIKRKIIIYIIAGVQIKKTNERISKLLNLNESLDQRDELDKVYK